MVDAHDLLSAADRCSDSVQRWLACRGSKSKPATISPRAARNGLDVLVDLGDGERHE